MITSRHGPTKKVPIGDLKGSVHFPQNFQRLHPYWKKYCPLSIYTGHCNTRAMMLKRAGIGSDYFWF